MTPLIEKLEGLSGPHRFWDKVYFEPNTGCWLWGGGVNQKGYGAYAYGPRCQHTSLRAHRVAYVAYKGQIPEGLHIDHLCRVRCCVNPDHLEAVTQAENNRRMHGGRCRKGHRMEGTNVIVWSTGNRECRTCRNARKREARRIAALRAMEATNA